ncbi:interferon-induced protein with tetratricopeptide repeats 5-like [Pelobates fuscus]|uniref:interferon-induced protein with tetratricopeptide repeats 5-like n=1 Tax=Pelobates fuscus TaxID=191477 RepID=UPI002FE4650E
MTFIMQLINESTLKSQLIKLRCHFTWDLHEKEGDIISMEEKVSGQQEYLVTEYKYMVYNLMAYLKHMQGHSDDAIANLEEAEKICLSNSTQTSANLLVIYGNCAWVYYKLNQSEKSQHYIDKVNKIYTELQLSTDPEFSIPEIYGEQGWSFLQYGEQYYEKAKECFEKALEEAPDDPEWNSGYATAVYRFASLPNVNYDQDLLQPLERAIELNPKDTVLKALLGLTLQDLNRQDEGLKYIEEAIDEKPDFPYLLRYVAKFYRRAGMIDEALNILSRALNLLPTSAFLHHQIGLCHRHIIIANRNEKSNCQYRKLSEKYLNEHIQKAIFHFELTLEYEKSFHYAYIDLANVYREAKQNKKAEETFKKVLAFENLIGEDKQQILFQYGRFAEYSKKSEWEAMEHYKEALLIPCSWMNSEKCERDLQRLAMRKIRRDPSEATGYGLLGLVYKVQGNITKAAEYYEKALKHDPSNDEYTRALCELAIL